MNDMAGVGGRAETRAWGTGVFCAVMLLLSAAPAVLTFKASIPDVDKVEEMRTLAGKPVDWEGSPLALDKNFAAWDRWFNDHLAYRSWMIRLKNHLDYSLFRSSGRTYFGKHNEIYGRHLLDRQLPASEHLFADSATVQRITAATKRVAADLKANGITMILVTPMQRQHFTRQGLPFYAPRIGRPSHFMGGLYPELKAALGDDFIDVYSLMLNLPPDQPRFFKQDFHWSDFAAWQTSRAIVQRIATLEGRPSPWKYALETYTKEEIGADARFAALMTAKPVAELRVDNRKWPAVHRIEYTDPAATGMEYRTDVLDDPALLPATCLYGNSFSDGMVNVGLLNHFQSMPRMWRDGSIKDVPKIAHGQCRYLIVQLLDISPQWPALAE